MNIILLKGIVSGIGLVVATTCVIIFLYGAAYKDVLALIRGEDYILYAPQLFPVLFLFPVVVLADLFFISCLFILSIRGKVKGKVKYIVNVVLGKLIIPVTIYGIIAIVIGILVSLVVSIYPLSTHYYKCDSTSILSPGSHYARTKEMCKERARLRQIER